MLETHNKNKNFTHMIALIHSRQRVALHRSASIALLLAVFGLSAHAASVDPEIQRLQRSIQAATEALTAEEAQTSRLDHELENRRQSLRSERNESYRYMHNAKRDIARQMLEIERISQSINLIDQQIMLVKKESQRSQERYDALNPIKKGLEANDLKDQLANNELRISKLSAEKMPLQTSMNVAREKLGKLKSLIPQDIADDAGLDNQPEIISLTQEKAASKKRIDMLKDQLRSDNLNLTTLRESRREELVRLEMQRQTPEAIEPVTKPLEFENAPAVGVATIGQPHVIVISGDTDIEQALKLRPWVESYGARYIEARWNGIEPGNNGSRQLFREDFSKLLKQIPVRAKLIIIGHGRGGGAAIEAATDLAYHLGRNVDLLAVLDPAGNSDLRANIVYDTEKCPPPESNADGYMQCMTQTKKRVITDNVKYFYNRWQKEAEGPRDFVRNVSLKASNGDVVEAPTATGRFVVANATESDQKRIFFGSNSSANKALLEQEAGLMPNLLVKYLR